MNNTPLNVKRWKKFWNNKIQEIKINPLDASSIDKIWKIFIWELQSLMRHKFIHHEYQTFMETTDDLLIAIQISYTKYKSSKPTLLRLFMKDKLHLPDINLIKVGLKK